MKAVKAAWLEKDGLGQFILKGKSVLFKENDSKVIYAWPMKSKKEAEMQLKMFRASTKHVPKDSL